MNNLPLEARHLEITHEIRWALNNASAYRLQASLTNNPEQRAARLSTAQRYEAHADMYQARLRYIESILA